MTLKKDFKRALKLKKARKVSHTRTVSFKLTSFRRNLTKMSTSWTGTRKLRVMWRRLSQVSVDKILINSFLS